ncbi:putative disease resistance protein [Labeo rohita]|uniref:Disease resistance protein n=1 Tax=Labeo rohita TaxID=84645 RepID=A0ABQ8LAY6_LABRO|nr:putative disease resistance protein [Labeo rohita]
MRDCVLRCLSVFLNQDLETLIKEYVDCEHEEAESRIAQTTMGIYVIQGEGANP